MVAITGNEAFWGGVKISSKELDYINDSSTLVQQLLQYQSDFSKGLIGAFGVSENGGIEFIASGVQFASNYSTWTPEIFVGELAHEMGHYINQAADAAFSNEYEVSSNSPDAYSIDAMIGLHREGEAVFNNYVVQQEISAATGGQGKIYLAGADNSTGTSTGLQQLLDAQHSFDQADGYTPDEDKNLMIEQAMGVYSTLSGSAVTNQTYYDYYGQINGAKAPAQAPDLAGVTFTDPAATGNFTTEKEVFNSGQVATQSFDDGVISASSITDQFGNVISQTVYSHNADGSFIANIYDGQGHLTGQDQFHSDGSEIAYQLPGDGTQNATVYNSAGQETEHATFGTNGQMTQDVFYDASTGRETGENDYSADGSHVNYVLGADGSQAATAYNAAGQETEHATFGTNGNLTQDNFYDGTTGRLTEQDDYNPDGSAVAHLFNADGTQNAIVFNTAGHETEQANFDANGQKTQDNFYDGTTGRLTEQENYNSDGSAVAHLFNADGTQNAIVFNAAGHETEQASFDASGKLTQDAVFDPNTGRNIQETDYNPDGSGVMHLFNADGTQQAAVFDPSGNVTEYAYFNASGKMIQDAFYDPVTGRETQINIFNSNGTTEVHAFNADGTQTAAIYNASGHEIEFANFDANAKKTDDYFFDPQSGRETEYNQYHDDGSMTAWLFNPDNTTDAIIFNGNGQELEYDTYDSSGLRTGFTQFTYGAGGGYNAVAYGPTGYELGWSAYNGSGGLIDSGGSQYGFTVYDPDQFECTSDTASFAASFEQDIGYSCYFDF
jgi:hypothetical protein